MANNTIETYSATWRAVKDWAEARIVQHQRSLEASGLDQAQTENLRGAIRELRLLIAAPNREPINAAGSASAE